MGYTKKSKPKINKIFKKTFTVFVLLFMLVFTLILARTRQDIRQHAQTTDHPTGTYTDWNWPSTQTGYSSFEWNVTVLKDPTPAGYFWSHQFGFKNGNGGYAGLQSNGTRRSDGSIGKLAIFSIWDTTESQGPACGKFGGEGEGQSCSVAYEWIVNRSYKFRVSKISGDSNGSWWGAWVKDTVTQEEEYIGQIKLPASWGALNEFSIMWSENFAPPFTRCENLIHSSVSFNSPTANGGNISPTSHHNHLGEPQGCPGSSSQDINNGVQQDMGINENQSPKGLVDEFSCSRIRGWAFDPSESRKSIAVHVYINGAVGTPDAEGFSLNTSVDRPDVNNAYGIEGIHGFDWLLPDKFHDGRSHDVFVYAIDSQGGTNPEIGHGNTGICSGTQPKLTLTPSPTVSPTKFPMLSPIDPAPTFVCGGSPNSICNPTSTVAPSPTINHPNPTETIAPTVTDNPQLTPVPTSIPDTDCLDPRSTPEKIQDWVKGFLQKINNYIQSIMGNPQNPNRPAPPQPCINR